MALFESQSLAQCPLWFSPSHPTPLRMDTFAHPWLDLRPHAFRLVKLIPAVLCSVSECVIVLLSSPEVVLRTELRGEGVPLADSYQERSVVSAPGQDMASSTRDMEVVGVAVQGQSLAAVASGLPANVLETIDTPSRHLYFSKRKVFESWCSTRAVDPFSCSVGSVEPCLEFAPGLVKEFLCVLYKLFSSQVVMRHSFCPPPFPRLRRRSFICFALFRL